MYPDALKEVSEGISGYIYEIDAEESQIIPFKNIPCARLATEPVKVKKCTRVDNAYNLFMEYARQGKMKVGYFKDKTPEQLEWWYSSIINYLEEKNMASTPDCSYACFIKKKFPEVWKRYITSCH